ncbi:hypothetical protein ACJ41O_003135 [Fusarium nematophilum]
MSPTISTVTGNPLTLSSLPAEVIQNIVENLFDSEQEALEVAYKMPLQASWDAWTAAEPEFDHFQVWRDALSFAATCRDLHCIVSPMVYKLDAEVNESSAMMISAKRGNIAALTKSLERGASVHVGDCTETVVIQVPPILGDLRMTNRKIWVPLKLRGQVTAIHWAAYLGHHDVLDILLKHGAEADSRVSVDHMDPNGEAIQIKSRRRDMEFDYPINFRCRPFVGTLERLAAPMAGIRTLFRQQVLEQGANPLYFALLTGQVEVARSLIRAGSSLLTHIGTGVHALHQAVDKLDVEMVRLILEDDTVDPNVRDARRQTPLHYIRNPSDVTQAFKAHQIIGVLVKRGADLDATNILGFTPLNSYTSAGDPLWSIAVAFIRAGSKIFKGFWKHFKGKPEVSKINWAIESSCEKGSRPRIVAAGAEKEWPAGGISACYQWFYMKFHGVDRVPDELRDMIKEEWEFYWTTHLKDVKDPVRPFLGGILDKQTHRVIEMEDEDDETEKTTEEAAKETTREENTGKSLKESLKESPEQPDQEPEVVDEDPDQEFDEDFDGEFDYDENFAKLNSAEFVEDDQLWSSL